MTKLTLLGSCSGTEPMPGRHHTSFAIESEGNCYIFDAGENCAYRAHLEGIDLEAVRAIFISHPHIDHVGGLANLVWTMRKLGVVRKQPHRFPEVDLFLPAFSTWQGVEMILGNGEKFKHLFEMKVTRTHEGLLFDDGILRVSAFPNTHIPPDADGNALSFCHRIEVDGKVIVFSGDVKTVDETLPAIGDGCDILLMETGHHKVADVCDFVNRSPVRRLVFLHHGREILLTPKEAHDAARNCRIPVSFGEDGMNIPLE